MSKTSDLIADLRRLIASEKEFFHATRVWTPQEWKARDEEYGQTAACVVTTEDSLYEGINYGGLEYMFAMKFFRVLQKHGFWYEPAYQWMLCIYPLKPGQEHHWDWLDGEHNQQLQAKINDSIVRALAEEGISIPEEK